MKILFLSGSNSRNAGGVFVTALETGKKLIKNHNLLINYLMYDDEYSTSDSQMYPRETLKTYSRIGSSNFGFSFNLYKQIEKIKPDLIHTQTLWLFLSHIVTKYYFKSKTPFIISPHGMLDNYQLKTSQLKKKIALLLFQDRNLKMASCIHALNALEYEAIRKLGYKNPIAIIPNGVNLPDQNYIPKVPKWKSNDRKTLLFLSRIDAKKNIHSLLKAWLTSNYRKHSWDLVIAGDLKNKSYVEELITISGTADSIKFVGGQFNEEKDSAFYHCDAFILPSFSEGLPMAILEAWSFKKFSIFTEECNLPIAFEQNVALKISTDVESIKTGLNSLFDMSEQERINKGELSYRLVANQFTWDNVAERFDILYRWVIAGGPKPNFVILD